MVLTGPTTNSHIAESTHWYGRDGTPQYEVPRADGNGMRDATLRDARKHGWYPGVTSIIRCAAAPGLEIWKQNQVMLATMTLPRLDGENDVDFCARVIADSGEQAKRARERGTEIHAAVQGHYEGTPPAEEMWPYVQGVTAAIAADFGERPWVSERPCAHELGFGTKADLSCPAIILDFKGAEFDAVEAPKLKTWDEHHMQLAATRKALRYLDAECAIAFVSRNVPGLTRIIRVDEPELERGWDMFRGLLNYWQAKAKYWPALWTPAEKVAA